MSILVKHFQLLLLLALWAEPLTAASDFFSIFDAARDIVAGRTFENEDGIRLEFSNIRRTSPAKAELSVKVTFPSGKKNTFREVIVQDGQQVKLEQIEGRSRPVPFFISIDEPFHVLRIRPMDTSNTEFLSRECLYQEADRRHFCYVKSKIGSEVFVSVFVETETCDR